MKKLILSLTFIYFICDQSNSFSIIKKQSILLKNEQIILILTKNAKTHRGVMLQCSKLNNTWVQVGLSKKVVIGINGFGCGVGLYKLNICNHKLKEEGDKKSPSGIFQIGNLYVKNDKLLNKFLLNTFLITKNTFAIDDPNSKYYNQVVSIKDIKKDWETAENMFAIDVYDIALEICHNKEYSNYKAGSCIFIHRWRSYNQGTLGCTAMSQKNLIDLLKWLDKRKNPIIIQLTLSNFFKLVNTELDCLKTININFADFE